MAVRTESAPKARTRGLASRHPLSPTTFLLRNVGKSLPLVAVIVLAVMLVVGVISMMNSIPFSIKTIYRYSQAQVAITPRGDSAGLDPLLAKVREAAPVPIGRVLTVRGVGTQVQSIVGKWPFVVLGLKPDDLRFYLLRHGVPEDGVKGRLPKAGAPEVVVSAPVAQNLKLKLGSVLLGPEEEESYSPYPVRVVGIARTEDWLMAGDYAYQRENHFPPVDAALVFARSPDDQPRLDAAVDKALKGARAQVFTYAQIRKQSDEMFATLYQILNVVIATLVGVITLMMGMLINIYQSQRITEFGLLQAIGYNKGQLLRRSVIETVVVVILGWGLGLLAARGLLSLVKATVMDPKAFALNVNDPTALAYTIPLPVAILAVGIASIVLRFRKFDPVAIVERRLA